MSVRQDLKYGGQTDPPGKESMMADDTPTVLSAEPYEYAPARAGATSSTGLAFWAPFALVSMTAFVVLTQVAAA